MAGVFTATTRIPDRPLSYLNKDMRYMKEILVDYENGMIYVSDENKNLISVASQVYKYLLEEGELTDFISNFIVKIPKPGFDVNNPPDIDNPADDDKFDKVVLPQGIFKAFLDIEVIKNNLKDMGGIIDKLNNDSNGEIQIDPNNIKQDATHQFLTQAQINEIKLKVKITEIIVPIKVANITGSGTDASPYICTINLPGAHPSQVSPDMSISYTGTTDDIRNSNLNGFSCIKRFEVLEVNKGKLTFNTKPVADFAVKVRLYISGLPSK